MDHIKQIVRQEVEKYAAGGRGVNILLFASLMMSKVYMQ